MIKQVLFRDLVDDEKIGGIQLDDGSIICGCCGALIEANDPDFEVIRTFDFWVPIADDIAEGGQELAPIMSKNRTKVLFDEQLL